MEKAFLLYLSVHWGDLIEQIKKNICHIHFNTKQPTKEPSLCSKVHDPAQSFVLLLRTGLNYVTNTLLLARSSARSKQLLCFGHRQGDFIGPRSNPLPISSCITNKTNNN